MSARSFTTRPELRGNLGMVAASHWLAAQSGMAMLERGGNAFDAAAAAGFVLEVVEPHQNGPGGEAPMILYDANARRSHVLCGQGPAPRAATAERFGELDLDLVPGTGLLAACVPGALGAWFLLLERFGTMHLRAVLEPAIALARNGFPVLGSLSQVLGALAADPLLVWPSTIELWLHHGVPPAGARVANPALAGTFERILEQAEAAGGGREHQLEAARRAVYEGFVAEAIDTLTATPVPDECGVHHGLLSGDDLASWRATLEDPVRRAYRDVEVLKTGPWGQGPVMLQQLGLLEGIDVASLELGGEELVHLVTECAKLAFADREAWYGDPEAVEVPLEELLAPSYCAERRLLVGEQASLELRPGSPGGRQPRLPAILAELAGTAGGASGGGHGAAGAPSLLHLPGDLGSTAQGTGGQTARRSGDTCHLDVVDGHGNMISATPSGGWLQSSPAIPGLGFCLGTRAQMFWVEQGLASSIGPGRRPRTTLSPSLVLRDGRPVLAFGTPGGDQQDQWTLCFLIAQLDHGLGLQAAIDAANWHTNHFASSFYPRRIGLGELVVEPTIGKAAIAALGRRGHRVIEAPPWSLGRVTAVGVDAQGFLTAGADPRLGQAYAVGR